MKRSRWNWRVEFEGLMAVADALRNSAPAMANRALPGQMNYPQILELTQCVLVRLQQFLVMLNGHLAERSFIATDYFSRSRHHCRGGA